MRKFRNKLGLIFHHHHHHHHHDDDDDDEIGHALVGHKKKNSMWKPLKKMLHHDNRGIQKVKKSMVSSVPHKHQVKQFHGLMEGLLRHVRHSKKSKKGSKGRIGLLGNRPRVGNKKVAKKLQWWKMLRRQGGVKLSIRVGLMRKNKKPLLKMLKMS